MAASIAFSCQDSRVCDELIDVEIYIHVKDQAGNNLLLPSTIEFYRTDEIKLSVELNGVRTDVTKEYQKSDRFKVQTMNGETYLMVNANLLKFSILWRVGDEDIFEEVITQLSNTFCPGAVCSQVRLNGTLKYDNTMYNDHKRIIEVVK